jgi:molybdopterin converting factor small subunit
MKVNVKYFGMIAEKIQCQNESLTLDFKGHLNMRNFFLEKYPALGQMNFQIAINQELNETLTESSDSIEIALLPPFAGG